jgi:ribonuclease VapC
MMTALTMSVRDRTAARVHIVEVVPVARSSVDRAVEGWRRFGRGRQHAALDFGDLFAYALAVSLAGTVLCTGTDFAQTDVAVLTPPG